MEHIFCTRQLNIFPQICHNLVFRGSDEKEKEGLYMIFLMATGWSRSNGLHGFCKRGFRTFWTSKQCKHMRVQRAKREMKQQRGKN